MQETSTVTPRLSSRRSGARSHVPANALLEKKRQTDRQSQRVVRDRTKKYISHLENLVDTLQKNQQDERLQRMTLQCKRLHDENEQLRNAITSITRTIQGVDKLDLVKCDYSESPNAQVLDSKSGLPVYASPSYSTAQSPMEPTQKLACAFQANPYNPAPLPATETANEASDGKLKPNLFYGHENTHVFVVISNLLRQAETCRIMSMDPEKDADIAIRAVAHGWAQTEQCCELDPAWQILRQIDQDICCCCGPVEKLAILRVVRLKLLQLITSTNEQQIQAMLPTYMHSKTLQAPVEHPSLIDYFVWPQLREYLVMNNQVDPSNKIAAAFATSLRFLWPYDLSDTWIRNRETGLYSFSTLFEEKLNDVKSWAMGPDFFISYPHLIGCIPCYEPTGDVPLGK